MAMRKSQGKITDSQNQTNNEIRRGRHNTVQTSVFNLHYNTLLFVYF